MIRLRCLTGSFLNRPLTIVLALLFTIFLLQPFLLQPAWSQQLQDEVGDMHTVLRREAVDLFNIGIAQYKRSLYLSAEVTFLRAQRYGEYLTGPEQEQLADYLEKVHLASINKEQVLEHLRRAEELLGKDELIRAKAHLKKIRNNKMLSDEEKLLVSQKLEYIDSSLAERKRRVAELYNRSVDFYRSGQLERARDGFTQVANNGLLVAPKGQTAEDYLMKISQFLSERGETLPSGKVRPVEQIPEFDILYFEQKQLDEEIETEQKSKPFISLFRAEQEREPAVVVKQNAEKKGIVDEVDSRKSTILQSYTKAVMADTSAKVEDYIARGRFEMAEEAVRIAQATVSENKPYIGDGLYKQYNSQLQQFYEQIEKSKKSGKKR